LHSNPDAINLMRELMVEFAAVANACGYTAIDAELIEFQLARATVREPPGVEPSMMADALAGRNMEVEAIVGNVYRLGQEKGVKTPLLRTIYLLAGALNESFTRARQ
jgi:2-dehydropantoate 2-reductase